MLASNGIDLPVLNVFRMFGQMGGERVPVESTGAIPLADIMKNGVRAAPDISALASLEGRRLCVLAWHYHDDDLPGPDAAVEVDLNGLPANVAEAKVQQFRVDGEHSNAFAAWQRMGSPKEPGLEQRAQLEKAGQLEPLGGPITYRPENGRMVVRCVLPRQAVALLAVTW